jgi:N-acetylneuraminic acid mutarotase
MPTGRAGFAIAVANNRIYAIGGSIGDDCNITSIVEAYDPKRDLWTTQLANLPRPKRWRPSAGTLDDIIYVVGGAFVGDDCPGYAFSTVQAYDPAKDKWSAKSDMNVARRQVGVGVDSVNHLLYAIGGATGGPDLIVLNTFEVFDPAGGNDGKGLWTDLTPKAPLNIARALPAVAVVNGKIYAVGGQAPNNTALDTVEVYDPSAINPKWTITKSRMPNPRLNPGAAVLNGKIYVVGGRTDILISSVDIYDPVSDTWTAGLPLPTARRGLGAAVAVVGDDLDLFALGGEALVTTVGQQFTYQITASNDPTSFNAFPLPYGLSIDSERGIISGTPTIADDSFDLTFTATNSTGSGSRVVSFYIAPPPPPDLSSISSSTCVTGRVGQLFTFQVLTNYAGVESRLMATGLPYQAGLEGGPELTINPGTGVISGTVSSPIDKSTQSFGVGLNLTDGLSVQSFLQLTFVSDPFFPIITSSSNTNLVLNKFFSYSIIADASVTTFDYIGHGALDDPLPLGLSFDGATGTISGIYSGESVNKPPPGEGPAQRGADKGLPESRINGSDTIKKEPPPKIQMEVENDTGTGTAPLNFFISLHDFEVEALPSTTSQGINYVIFTDDALASGTGAGLVETPKTGDYVTYTVPVAATGTYDVKAGIRTGASQGIFQLSIDGLPQGSRQDEYSPEATYEVRDLGSVTFSSAGEKIFQFSVADRNPASNGYELVFDYLDLVPRFEAQPLMVQSRPALNKAGHESGLGGHADTQSKAIRLGNDVTYTVPVPTAGIYNLLVKAKEDGNTGGFGLSIDGTNQGYFQNCGPSGDGFFDLGTVNFKSPGEKAFQFQVEGCGTGNDFILDYIDLILATQLEAENLPADSSARLARIADNRMSHQEGILLKAQRPDDSVTFDVTIPIAGTYGVKLGLRTGNQNGIFQLAIDGVNQGGEQDEYSAEVGYQVLDLGRVTFVEGGEKTFQFVVKGKNPSSSGYQFILDYIDLIR